MAKRWKVVNAMPRMKLPRLVERNDDGIFFVRGFHHFRTDDVLRIEERGEASVWASPAGGVIERGNAMGLVMADGTTILVLGSPGEVWLDVDVCPGCGGMDWDARRLNAGSEGPGMWEYHCEGCGQVWRGEGPR